MEKKSANQRRGGKINRALAQRKDNSRGNSNLRGMEKGGKTMSVKSIRQESSAILRGTVITRKEPALGKPGVTEF